MKKIKNTLLGLFSRQVGFFYSGFLAAVLILKKNIMKYDSYRYIYPPRPANKIDPKCLDQYDKGEYYAQPKLNGSCCVVFLSGNSKPPVIMNRHNQQMTNVKTDQIAFEKLHRGNGYMVLVGELLNKSKCGEDGNIFNQKFIIWDIIVFNGEHLLGTTFEQRQKLLYELYLPIKTIFGRYILQTDIKGVYMPFLFDHDFSKVFYSLIKTDMYEGIVLKKKSAKLSFGFHENNNTEWQVKCRKPTKKLHHLKNYNKC